MGVPVGDAVSSDAELGEVGAHVVWHPAEILGDDFGMGGGI